MSCRDKHLIAWKSFEIGDGILYTEDDVKKICPTPSLLGLNRSWIIHFAIKRRRDNVKKKPEKENENTIGNEIATSDQLVNAMQGTFTYAEPICIKTCIYI